MRALALALALAGCGAPVPIAVVGGLVGGAAAGATATYNIGSGLHNQCLGPNPPPICFEHRPKPGPGYSLPITITIKTNQADGKTTVQVEQTQP